MRRRLSLVPPRGATTHLLRRHVGRRLREAEDVDEPDGGAGAGHVTGRHGDGAEQTVHAVHQVECGDRRRPRRQRLVAADDRRPEVEVEQVGDERVGAGDDGRLRREDRRRVRDGCHLVARHRRPVGVDCTGSATREGQRRRRTV